MAKPTLQVKNVASLLLAAGASIASALASRRFFVDQPDNWQAPTAVFVLCLSCQLALVFVESKEEEELSLQRKRRLEEAAMVQQVNITRMNAMIKALENRDTDHYTKLDALRKP